MVPPSVRASSNTYDNPKDELDVGRYLARINFTRHDLSPTLQTLQQLHYQHALSISFENLTPFLKLPVPLDIASLQKKLVDERRGGYCFEQNRLFRQVLLTLGFKVQGLAARVLWNAPVGATTARAHMLLLVHFDEETFIADVGFGGLTLTTPLLLNFAGLQTTSHETFRLLPVGNEFNLQARIQGAWKPMYRFGLQEQFTPDYEVLNWFASTNPSSPFVNGITVAKTSPKFRCHLRNNELSTYHVSGETEKELLSSPTQVKTVLEEVFQLPVSNLPQLDQALQRIF